MTNHNNSDSKYDLVERTALLGESVIDFVQQLPRNAISNPLISQVVRSSTSVGANYMEADTASSKKDFVFKIGLCRKEAKETCHWLRMIMHALPETNATAKKLYQEAYELVLIFSSIIKNSQ